MNRKSYATGVTSDSAMSPDLPPLSPNTTSQIPPRAAGTNSHLADLNRFTQESYIAYNRPYSLVPTTTGGGGLSTGIGGFGGTGTGIGGGVGGNEITGARQNALQPSVAPTNTHGVLPSLESQIPSVNPVVNAHDRLWSEVDVLDDAADLADRVRSNGSFFGPTHAKALDQLRNAQIELAQMTAEAERKQDRSKYRVLWEKSDLESLRNALFDEEHFKQLSALVDNTASKLDEVAELMKSVDEQSKEFWSTLN